MYLDVKITNRFQKPRMTLDRSSTGIVSSNPVVVTHWFMFVFSLRAVSVDALQQADLPSKESYKNV